MKLLSNLDLAKNELQNARIQNLSSAPSSPAVGQIYYDTTAGALYVYDGSTWDLVGAVQSVGVTAPIQNTGTSTAVVIAIAAATTSDPGSMSAADKAKLDAATSANTNSAIVRRDGSGDFAANIVTVNQVTINGTPSSATDAATKGYVDAAVSGLKWKDACRAATTANITLSGAQTIDGVSVIAGDRVLVKSQSTASQNGIYVCASGSWSRATDADAAAEILGMACFVAEGAANADTAWVCTTNAAITLGSTSLSFSQFAGGGTFTAGTGITITGNSIAISASYVGQATITTLGTITTGVWTGTAVAVLYGGTGASSAAGARTNLGATGKYSATIGDGSSTSIAITQGTHGLAANAQMTVEVCDASSGDRVYPDISINNSNGTVTIAFAVAPSSNAYRVVLIG